MFLGLPPVITGCSFLTNSKRLGTEVFSTAYLYRLCISPISTPQINNHLHCGAMNEHLAERFGRSRQAKRDSRETADLWIQPAQLNPNVRQYFQDAQKPVDGGSWLSRPEVPSSAEVLDIDVNSSTSSDIVEIVPNKREGAWESKGEPLPT
jgi:hypothetical protein